MLSGTEERKIPKRDRKVKVKNFPGATVDDTSDYIKPLLKKCPDNIILHVGINNKKHLKLSQKNDFLAHFGRFLVYAFLRPVSYTPIFCQIKCLIEVHNCGKFH